MRPVFITPQQELEAQQELDQICLRLQENDPQLTTLSTWPFHGLDFGARLRECLRDNTHVRKLELANLESREAENLAAIIAESNLTTIRVSGHDLFSSYETLATERRAKQVLFDGIRRSRSIREIVLAGVLNDVLDGFSEILVNVPSISTFKLFHKVNLGQLPTVLANSFLTTFELDHVDLRDYDLAGLGQTRLLKRLVLTYCYLDDASLGRFIGHWPRDSPLETLRLPRNRIGPVGATLLLRAVAAHPNMRVLDLEGCLQIGFEGLRLIGEALSVRQHPLTELDISSCVGIENSNMDSSCHTAAKKQAGLALLAGVANNHHITKMLFKWPHLEPLPLNVMDQIDFKTAINRMGRHNMILNEHSLPPAVWSFIFFKCQRQPKFGASLVYFLLCEHPTL